MILVDTSIWVAHFKGAPVAAKLPARLEDEQVFTHPHVLGELALGGLPNEPRTLLTSLPVAPLADEREVLFMVDEQALAGRGIGWVDAHLLASARLAGATFWTRDKALRRVAEGLGLASDSL